MSDEKCFACGRVIRRADPIRVDTRDAQTVFVGPECYKRVLEAGDAGWLPPGGCLRLYPMPPTTTN